MNNVDTILTIGMLLGFVCVYIGMLLVESLQMKFRRRFMIENGMEQKFAEWMHQNKIRRMFQ